MSSWFQVGVLCCFWASLCFSAEPTGTSPRHPSAGPEIPAALQEVQSLVQQGKLAEGIARLRSVLAKAPDSADAHLMLGTFLSLVPERSEAIEALARAIELRPNFAPGYNTAGMALARLGEIDSARTAFEHAVRLDPEMTEAHQNLALALAQRGEFAKANDSIGRSLELETDPDKRAYLYYLNGKLYNEQDLPERAIDEFEKALALRGDYGEAYFAVGVTRQKLLEEDLALPALRKAVDLEPEHSQAHYHLGVELLRRGDAAEASKHLLKANDLMPGNQAVVYNLTRALRRAGREPEYEHYRKKLSEMIEADNRARARELETATLNSKATELTKDGDLRGALDKYRTALEAEPTNGILRRNLALILARLGRWDEAIQELREIVREDPNDEEATRTLHIVLDRAAAAKSAP